MRLGNFIKQLEAQPPKNIVILKLSTGVRKDWGELSSYRGYYDELAIQSGSKAVRVEEALLNARAALNSTFTGYKGGDFKMFEFTPIWISEYGECEHEKVCRIYSEDEITYIESFLDE